jgi:hypothetical protein
MWKSPECATVNKERYKMFSHIWEAICMKNLKMWVAKDLSAPVWQCPGTLLAAHTGIQQAWYSGAFHPHCTLPSVTMQYTHLPAGERLMEKGYVFKDAVEVQVALKTVARGCDRWLPEMFRSVQKMAQYTASEGQYFEGNCI